MKYHEKAILLQLVQKWQLRAETLKDHEASVKMALKGCAAELRNAMIEAINHSPQPKWWNRWNV